MDQAASLPRPREATGVIDLKIEGMTCASCVARVEKALARVDGVGDVRVNLASEEARLAAPVALDPAALVEAVEAAGYRAVAVDFSVPVPGDSDALDAVGAALGRLRPTLFAYQWVLTATQTAS